MQRKHSNSQSSVSLRKKAEVIQRRHRQRRWNRGSLLSFDQSTARIKQETLLDSIAIELHGKLNNGCHTATTQQSPNLCKGRQARRLQLQRIHVADRG